MQSNEDVKFASGMNFIGPCKHCGMRGFRKYGFSFVAGEKVQLYQCLKCGRIVRGKDKQRREAESTTVEGL
jgi:hypothetical protein